MLRKLVVFLISSGLAAKGVQYFREQRARQRRGVEREAVQRWENEGGSRKPPRTAR